MPYICLARNDIPDGTLQVLDLVPNTSLRNQSIDPPGQTRYLKRTRRVNVGLDANTGVVTRGGGVQGSANFLTGLEAYLLDRVEPGSLQVATGTIVMAAQPNVGDRVVIKGIIFEFQAGANPVNWNAPQDGTDGTPFLVGAGASANDAAANLTLAINDVGAVQAAILAAAPANTTATATNPAAPSPNVVLSAEDNLGAPLLGRAGDLTVVVTVGGARITQPAAGRMGRTDEAWTEATLVARAGNLQGACDAGLPLTLAVVNGGAHLGAVGADLTGAAATSASTGTLLQLLSILAGREYRIAPGALKFTAAAAPDSIHLWDATQRGAFTQAVSVFDSQMLNGEIRPNARFVKRPNISARSQFNNVTGGDAVNRELGDVRYNVAGESLDASLDSGTLAQMVAATNTLFPDNPFSAFKNGAHPSQPGPQTAEVNNVRLVTVYADDGSVL